MSVSSDLYHISAHGEAYLLHRERLSSVHISGHSQGLGAVDYLQELLCWSPVDRILCAHFRLGSTRIENPVPVLNVAESAIFDVCQGMYLHFSSNKHLFTD